MLREKIKIIQLDEVNSTNIYAKQNLDSLHDRTVISSNRQLNGHGRFNRVWVDFGEGNLFMSVVLKPSYEFKEVYANLTQYMSVCLCRVLETYGLNCNIKWPNDVLINGKKIAGILSETVMHGNNFKGFVLGIGVNLNARADDLKTVKENLVTALNIELEPGFIDKNLFTDKLLNEFFDNYDEFLQKGFSYIEKDYIDRVDFLNKEISVRVFNEMQSGIAKRINSSGELVLEQDNKELILTMGDIL